MAKSVFLYVHGSDYSALDFEQNFNAQEVYKNLLEEGKRKTIFDTDDYYIEVAIKEFEGVDNKFIEFVSNELCDYDHLKDKNIYRVE